MDTVIVWLNTLIPSQSTHNVPVLLIGFIFFSVFGSMLVALVIKFADEIPIKNSNTLTLMNVFRETSFLCISLASIMVWSIDPLAVLITLSPVYMLFSSFHLPFLKSKSEIDQKTGLLNSTSFLDTLKSEVKRANRYDRPLSLVMSDLDHMRLVNNAHGHLAGDQVLVEVGKALKSTFREHDFVARFGGEEFAIILPDTSHGDVIDVVERARATIDDMLINPDTCDMPIHVTMSFGIARRDEDTESARDLIDRADQALYHAKESGRNCIGIYKDTKVLCLTMPFSVPVGHSIATEQRMEFLR
jgi:diguanylate cyclase (GGDEF)-like protein